MRPRFVFAHTWLLLAGLALLVAGCLELEDLPDEPVINEMWYDTEVGELNIRFTDGDGDFGLAPRDTTPPFQRFDEDGEDNFYHYNLHVDLFYREEGEWVALELPPGALGNRARIPNLTPEGQNKQLRVLIRWDFTGEVPAVLPEGADTVKFEVVLIDRALNVSLPGEAEAIFEDN